MIKNILWIISSGLIRLSTNTMVVEVKNETSTMTDCVREIALLLGKLKVNLQYTPDREDLASKILRTLENPYVVNTKEVRMPEGIEPRTSDNLIVVLGDVKPEKVIQQTLWNGNTRFVIVADSDSNLANYFQDYWKFKVINVFVLVSENNSIPVYSFLPYSANTCQLEVIKVDNCLNGKLEKKGVEMTDQFRIKNMNGCHVNISVTEVHPSVIMVRNNSDVKGFESNMMKVIAKVYNFTSNFRLPLDGIGWGWIHPKPQGAIGEIYLGKSDFGIGMLAPLLERYENLDLSKTYNLDECVTFGVPQGSGPKKPAWIATFVLEFTISTWVLIAFSFAVITINMWLINRYSDVNWFGSKTELVIFVFSSCLGAPIKIPRNVSAKISVAYWIIFCFIITVAYKASMGSKLAVPPHDADIYTFNELLNSDLEVTGYKNMLQLFNHSDDWTLQNMKKRYRFTNYTAEHVVNLIANRVMMADLRHSTTFYYYSLINPKTRGRIHLLRECLLHYKPSVLLKKFSPFTNKISRIIGQLEESGIMVEWRAKYVYKVPPPPKPFLKLSLDHLFAVICVLLIGLFIAFLTFLCERSYYSNQPKKKFDIEE